MVDGNGKIAGCLGISGPSFRLDKDKVKFMARDVKIVARELTKEVTQR